jgi:hypothetical protein
MDIHERIVLLKMAIKYTMELYKSTDQEYILYMLKKVTKKYIDHISESDEFDNEALALEELLDILSSDTFS